MKEIFAGVDSKSNKAIMVSPSPNDLPYLENLMLTENMPVPP